MPKKQPRDARGSGLPAAAITGACAWAVRLLPGFPDVGGVADGGGASVAYDGLREHLLVFEQLVEALAFGQVLHERQRVLVFGLGVQQRIDAAHGAHHALQLALAHLLLAQVDELDLDAALFEITLCLLGIEALLGAEDLNVHDACLFVGVRLPCDMVSHGECERALTNEVRPGALRLGRSDARGASRFDAFEHPCHVAAQVAHGRHALGVLKGFSGRASKGDVPVG